MAGHDKILRADTIIDGELDAPIEDGAILIEDGRVSEVGTVEDVGDPGNATSIDLSGHTILPGLIDTHIHPGVPNITTFEDYRVGRMETTKELMQLYSMHHVRMILDMGFTTLRAHPAISEPSGDDHESLVAIRDAIDRGLFQGPRLITGGFVMITNGHWDNILPSKLERGPDMSADGPWGLRRLVRQKVRNDVDFIKTVASGGGGTPEEAGIRNMCQAEIDAIADEAKAFDVLSSCHCFTPQSQRMALDADIDIIEHVVFTEDETLDRIESEGKPMIPTLAHRSDRAIRVREEVGTDQFILDKMKRLQPYCYESFEEVLKRDIPIAMGTDMNIDPEMGMNALELEIYVDLGMTEMEAIKTATRNASAVIGMGGITGTLTPGKYADLVAVDGDPLEDISVLQEKRNIGLVMKEGEVVVNRTGELPKRFLFPDDTWDWERVHGRGVAPSTVDDLDLLPHRND